MAFKLPSLSKAAKEEQGEAGDRFALEALMHDPEQTVMEERFIPELPTPTIVPMAAPAPAPAPAPASAPREAVRESVADVASAGVAAAAAAATGAGAGAAIASPDAVPLPLIGKLPQQKQIRLLLIVLGTGLLLTILFLWLSAKSSAMSSTQTQIAGDALMHSQRIGKATPNAIQGNPEAFKQLADSRKEFNQDLSILMKGGDYKGHNVGAPSAQMDSKLAEVSKVWSNTDKAAETILKLQKELTSFGVTLQKLNGISPNLLDLSEQISTLKTQTGATPREIAASSQLVMLTQRLGRSANEFLTSEGVNPETAFLLGKDTNTFRDIVSGFLNGSDVLRLSASKSEEERSKLTELEKSFADYQESVASILGNMQNFVSAKQSEQLIFTENETLKQRLSALQDTYRDAQDTQSIWFWLMLLAALVTLLAAAGIAWVQVQDGRRRTHEADVRRMEAEEQRLQAIKQEEDASNANDQNQAAILRLMNELQEVADGDLTVQATVSEDITGAIADSVNYTVEELRGLVGRVTATAQQVTVASDQAQSISIELLAASQRQSRDIQETTQAVLDMATQITDVSKSASESAEVARQSVSAAEEGSKAVENAISGMNEIREHIQETSKRIKRLGESSQEIGEITELISDITEQTNVLALNAAIQAASAGEAGRGFSVVAEEVQRLAERSGAATKQIGALVRTIQTDTHDAVVAMERSTQGVVEGAKLSDAAGAALSDIRRVSNRLAELIQSISSTTEQQANSANGVATNIQNILSVTEKTREGTRQTALSIRELSKLAEDLKSSVSRFRVTN
ncbi:methyl-accepting chemotaxis (MCP) signaling domain protein [Collimonas arenae]|uniref:Methyl-accepting chemotaxis (MCP) signaling domain protein n=1 Tax=Collimonas arenae TaxID=279058 RepID=A0A127QEZ8_9BURK|nr:methyl-accepting chemotaxis protein [Collimonas arenae]AMP08566.1 methyl-accepting chemotaxis (MCP) signaling domain protein [Collimonas arenae]